MSHKFIKVTPSDYKILSDLCYVIYPQTYSDWWYDGGKWYMETMYNQEKMLEELLDNNTDFYFLEVNEVLCGYLKISYFYKNEPDSFEIERIYLNQNIARKGFGSSLLNFGIDLAHSMNRKTVYLKVMSSGSGQISFYEKSGFETVSSELLPFELLKTDYRILNTMIKKL